MRRPGRLHVLWLLAAALVAVAAFTPAAVAQPAPATTLNISGNADFVSSFQINVYVTVQGEGGTGFVSVQVQQARPPFPPQSGSGGTSVICDGQRRTYAVPVFAFTFPGWQLGEAEAFATASCPSGSDTDTQSIRITKT
jgi:hypothetical protein